MADIPAQPGRPDYQNSVAQTTNTDRSETAVTRAAPTQPAATGTPTTTTTASLRQVETGSATADASPGSAVDAARRRRRVPFWVMAALSLLPVWALMYTRALTTAAEPTTTPLGLGSQVYTNCSSCHLDSGQGSGTIYGFTNGDVVATFPHIEDQLRWTYFGTDVYALAGIEIYGNPERPGGPHVTGEAGNMPGWAGILADAEILAVTCHERYTLGDTDDTDEFDRWCAESSGIFGDLRDGGDLATLHTRIDNIIPIGTNPAAGSPAADVG